MKRPHDPLQGELFAVSDTPVETPPRPKTKTTSSRPKWSKYVSKNRVKCDDCLLLLAIREGNAPASRQARWRRVQDGSDLLLCYAHAQDRRVEDGLNPLED